MDSKQFATAVEQLIERANVPASKANAQGLAAIYQILGQLTSGELILAPTAKSVPEA